ncbi:hypothetical protein ABZS66_22725 [Dactylosporangium sp. NPDC005572]|uniref:hypothetical protein n=1 Tax=Dactylosporangium sp. NPDC005572 TaxID=3156889 RepID=UPI0033BAAD28
MARTTISEALRAMQHLRTADGGRLTGINLMDEGWRMPALRSAAAGWPTGLTALLAVDTAGTVTGDTPAYLVCSDGIPVCWLTYDGITVTATGGLSRNQAVHRDLAVAALAGVARHALGRLADLRDVRDGRPDDADPDQRNDRHGMARVANPECPARAWWVPVGAALPQTQHRVRTATGTDDPLILAAHGYGTYGRQAHRLQLDLLCAINAAAETHRVAGNVIGDWLAGEGGLTADPLPADEIVTGFAEAFIGVFSHELAYTTTRIAENGWEAVLHQVGAFEFFDTAAYQRHLFNHEVRAITNSCTSGGGSGGIIVCRRPRS